MALDIRIENLLLRLGPSETVLLDWLRPHIDGSCLAEIAACDGGFDEEENFQALKRIHEGQPMPVPLPWVPKEVLELTRWMETDYPPPPDSERRRGHLIRTFCCAILLKAADEPETRDHLLPENDTLIQLVASVLYLGREASENALHFLCWRVLQLPPDDDETPFFALAVLLLCAALFQSGQEGTELTLLADWVVVEEARARTGPYAYPKSDDWLLGLTFHDIRHEVWRKLAREILLEPTKSFPEPAATALREIAERLVPKRD